MNTERPTIFDYADPRDFIKDYLQYSSFLNPRFSMRSLSKKMGFKSNALLHFLISKKREVRPQHIEKILRGIQLSHLEQCYFEALVHSRTQEDREMLAELERKKRELCKLYFNNQNSDFVTPEQLGVSQEHLPALQKLMTDFYLEVKNLRDKSPDHDFDKKVIVQFPNLAKPQDGH